MRLRNGAASTARNGSSNDGPLRQHGPAPGRVGRRILPSCGAALRTLRLRWLRATKIARDLSAHCLWLYREERIWSAIQLVVADGIAHIRVLFHPLTDGAGSQAYSEQATQRGWAVELARHIIPRVAEALAVASETTAPSQAVEEPATAAPLAPPALVPSDVPAPSTALPPARQPPTNRTSARPYADAVARPDQISTDPIIVLQSATRAVRRGRPSSVWEPSPSSTCSSIRPQATSRIPAARIAHRPGAPWRLCGRIGRLLGLVPAPARVKAGRREPVS